MWIYPAAPKPSPAQANGTQPAQRISVTAKPRPEPKPQPAPAVKPAAPAISAKKGSAQTQWLRLGLCYLCGMLPVCLGVQALNGRPAEFLQFYVDSILNIHCGKDWMLVFSTEFLSAFVQLTLVLLCGLCAFGSPLVHGLLWIKGAGAGVLCSMLYLHRGIRGVVINLLLFWLPELLCTALLILFGRFAVQSAHTLSDLCFNRVRVGSPYKPQRLFFRYLVFCVVSMVPCALSAGLSALFAPLL